jgi:hypothetical protein
MVLGPNYAVSLLLHLSSTSHTAKMGASSWWLGIVSAVLLPRRLKAFHKVLKSIVYLGYASSPL